MKSLNEYMKESLLDDEEELLDKVDINLFDKLDNSKTPTEYQKFIDILLDSCEKINFKQIVLDDEKYDKITISSNGNFSSKELEELNKIYDDLGGLI